MTNDSNCARRRAALGARRGSVLLVPTLLVSTALASLALAGVMVTGSALQAQSARQIELSARYLAESGLSHAVFEIENGRSGALGTAATPLAFGNGSYWVESTPPAGGRVTLVSTGRKNGRESRIRLVLRLVHDELPFGVFAEELLTMDSNTMVDSYDSSLGTYRQQLSNGEGDFVGSEARVGSNGHIHLRTNSAIHGDANPGPEAMVDLVGNATVSGSTLPLDEPVELPAIQVPTIPSGDDEIDDLELDSQSTAVLESGQYAFDELDVGVGSTLLVRGPATLVCSDFHLSSGAELRIDGSEGPLQLFVTGTFQLESNVVLGSTTRDPAHLAVHLTADNIADPDAEIDLDGLGMDSNGRFFGSVYAPDSQLVLDSNFEYFGSLSARRIDLGSNVQIHFDERLLHGDWEGGETEVVLWRVLSSGAVTP